jgi:PAS domain-containing protein
MWLPFESPCRSSLRAIHCDSHGDGGTFVLQAPARELLGWSSDELAVVPAEQLVHPDDRDVIGATAMRVGGRTAPFLPIDVRLLSRDSRYWWTRWHLFLRPDGSTVAAGQCLLQPADTGPAIGVWSWDVGSDTVAWSAEVLDMFGFRRTPPSSYAAALDIVHADDREVVASRADMALAHGEPLAVTFRSAAVGRRDRWFHASGRRCETYGQRRLAGVVKDLNPVCGPHSGGRALGSG